MATSSAPTPRCSPGRAWTALGLGFAFLGVIGYAMQLWLRHLTTPWYLPALATLGLVCVGVSIWRARTVWRWLALLLVLMFAGASWAFVVLTRLPAYTGPVAVGQPFPAFATLRADGTPFRQQDLVGGKKSVLVFFRGRW
jgi:hypothetical protein